MNVLITGASGFLGGHCAEAFTHHGDTVRAIVRTSSRVEFLKSLGVSLHAAELDQADQLRQAMNGVDIVVHAATKVEPYGHWREFVEATIEGTRHVLQAAIVCGVRHFIYISSVGVYERPAREGTLDEVTSGYGTPYRWRYYAQAKIEAEKLVRQSRSDKRLSTTILRPTLMYGPHDTASFFGRIVPALRTRRVKWIGDGHNLLNLVYASDAANAIVLAATNPKSHGQIYNIADDENSPTQRQFITPVCELLGLPMPTGSLSYRLAHNLGFLGECLAHATGYRVRPPISRQSVLLLGGNRRFSNDKLKRELGWQPKVGFEEGIHRTVEWFNASRRAQTTTPSASHKG
jgi:nucleoside-diphosphate-sugar epimerase